MPIYHYKCEDCGVFSELKPVDERAEAVCPECGAVSKKTFEGMSFAVMNNAYLDGNRRFDDIRTSQRLKREKARARERGDLETERKVNKELKNYRGKS